MRTRRARLSVGPAVLMFSPHRAEAIIHRSYRRLKVVVKAILLAGVVAGGAMNAYHAKHPIADQTNAAAGYFFDHRQNYSPLAWTAQAARSGKETKHQRRGSL